MMIDIDDAELVRRTARRAGVSTLMVENVMRAFGEEYLIFVAEARRAEAEAAEQAAQEAAEKAQEAPKKAPPRKRAGKPKAAPVEQPETEAGAEDAAEGNPS